MKFFTVFILLSCTFFNLSPAHASSSTGLRSSTLKHPKYSIWKIQGSQPEINGTGFFIGTNHFITNSHVVLGLLETSKQNKIPPPLENTSYREAMESLSLSQEGNSSVIKIKKILAISALYDLVLLETQEESTHYLNINEDPKLQGKLFTWGYPKGKLTKIEKTGHFVDDDNYNFFPVNHSNPQGASGSPLLNSKEQVVGVVSSGYTNMLNIIRLNDLKDFIAGNIGTNCSELYQVECIKKEIEHLKQTAEQGSAFAQWVFVSGPWLFNNSTVGIEENPVKWLKKSAEQRFAPAQYKLAIIYDKGINIQQDFEMAFYWHQKAAEQGFAPAQSNLATIYHTGLGTQKNFERAFYWYKKAAKQGFAPAQYLLAYMYENGEGVKQNFKLAFDWYKKSAEQGFAPAQSGLARVYAEGMGTRRNPKLAAKWYKKAEEQKNHPVAQNDSFQTFSSCQTHFTDQ